MSSVYANNLPGIDAAVQSVENDYTWGPQRPWGAIGVVLDAAAVDAGNTPTTVLRRGLVLGKKASTGQYLQYDPTATDGTQIPVGILDTTTDMLDPRTGSTRDKHAQMLVDGWVRAGSLFGFDELARVVLSTRILFDDLRQEVSLDRVVAKTADYTVLATDNHTTFSTTGAGGAVNFTLPTLARGLRFRFHNVVAQNMVITGAANIVALNNAAATTITFSTGSQQIGACVEIVANEAGTKWLAFFGSTAAATLA